MEVATLLLVFGVRCLLVLVPFALFVYWHQNKNSSLVVRCNKIPGPKYYPLIGNLFNYLHDPVELFRRTCFELPKIGPIVRLWLVNKPQVLIYSARDAERILKDMAYHPKSENYHFLNDWMGQGLLTSRDEKWRVHRKVLTPAFHFNILQDFIPIFNKHAHILTDKLAEISTARDEQGFNIFPHASACTLDIICESSMGKDLRAQNAGNRDYVNSVISMNDLLTHRYFTPWLRPDFLYNLSPTKRSIDKHLNRINNFTDQVISERRVYLQSLQKSADNQEEYLGQRRRLAFLDLLLAAEAQGSTHMSQKDIRDQVSTFMFEGHDTVATATCWVLFILGTYPEVQQRVVEELEQVFGHSGRAPDMNDLANLKYLERCIKETLRLYPSVPFFERSIEEDLHLDHYVVPAGCTTSLITYVLHRDPEYWPNPEKFDPDRFLPENTQGRNPYAYIPFSAGPRNCIGQKFALLEEKAVVSTVLRRFRVEAAHSREDVELQIAMVLRPKNGLRIRLFERDNAPHLRIANS